MKSHTDTHLINEPDAMFRPPVNRAMKVLDRSFFQKTVPISAARVFQKKSIQAGLLTLEKTKEKLDLPRVQTVRPDPDEEYARSGTKCILLGPHIDRSKPATWSDYLREQIQGGVMALIPYTLHLDYNYWTYYDIMASILPEEREDDIPGSFVQAGHIAHLNLRENSLPYKQIIAQVILDKSNEVKTVINKIGDVGDHDPFRTFQYEVLIGPDDMDVTQNHMGCVFTFDYSKVFWNTRLDGEHRRIVSQLKEGEAVCDATAGVGPFVVPAGKKHVFAYGNDLNPESYKYMEKAITTNKVSDFVSAHNQDGKDFIRTSAYDLLNASSDPPVQVWPNSKAKNSKTKPPPSKIIPRPRTFDHYVMNLPATAIEFLPSFIGLYNRPITTTTSENTSLLPKDPRHLFKPHTNKDLPLVHVYCFHRETEEGIQEQHEICQRISEQLDFEITTETKDCSIDFVRKVAPHKTQFCATFRVPFEVAFKGLEMPLES